MKHVPIIIDCAMQYVDVLAQNPKHPAPMEILNNLNILEVQYVGFDGHLHQGQIVMHESVCEDVQGFFTYALALQFPIQKVIPISAAMYQWDDEVSCADNNSSGYNYRFIMGTERLSNHARGCAFDINPAQNIYIRYDEMGKEMYRSPKNATYDQNVPGTLTNDHPLVHYMKRRGWIWGGDWTSYTQHVVDYQHFEKIV